jgi:hypothetical protein
LSKKHHAPPCKTRCGERKAVPSHRERRLSLGHINPEETEVSAHHLFFVGAEIDVRSRSEDVLSEESVLAESLVVEIRLPRTAVDVFLLALPVIRGLIVREERREIRCGRDGR